MDKALNRPSGAWDHVAIQIVQEFATTQHPIFASSNPFQNCAMITKKRVQIIHFEGTDTNKAIISKVILAVNQLTILFYAVCRWFDERKSYTTTMSTTNLTSHQVTMFARSRKLSPARKHVSQNSRDGDFDKDSCTKKLDLQRSLRQVKSSSRTLKLEYRQATVAICSKYTSPRDNADAKAVSDQFWKLL